MYNVKNCDKSIGSGIKRVRVHLKALKFIFKIRIYIYYETAKLSRSKLYAGS